MKERLQGMIVGSLVTALMLGGVTAMAASTRTIEVTYGINVVVDGATQNFANDMQPFTSEGRTFLPVRGIADALGLDAQWDGATSTVYITSGTPAITFVPPAPTTSAGPIIPPAQPLQPEPTAPQAQQLPPATQQPIPEPTMPQPVPEPTSPQAAPEPTAPPTQPPTAPAANTVSQQNAIRSAETYLQVMSFSRSGLIAQLEFEGFSNAEASFAVDNITVDWYVQAERSAERYLQVMAFSRSALIGQLEFDGFTRSQAERGATSVGL